MIGVLVGLSIGFSARAQEPSKRLAPKTTTQPCGWVLWARGRGQGWNANSGFDTFGACGRRRDALQQLFDQQDNDGAALGIARRFTEFSCFPDSVDPRDR
jgi:hypothetical protein